MSGVPCSVQLSHLLRLLWAETVSQPSLIRVPRAAVPRAVGSLQNESLPGLSGYFPVVTLGWGLRGECCPHLPLWVLPGTSWGTQAALLGSGPGGGGREDTFLHSLHC